MNTQEDTIAFASADDVLRKAYQFVALSAAIAIQDAVEHQRSINTICTSIIGTAMAQAIETPGAVEQMQQIVTMAQSISDHADANCRRVSQNAAAMLEKFPRRD